LANICRERDEWPWELKENFGTQMDSLKPTRQQKGMITAPFL